VSHSHLALQHLIHKIDSADPRQKRSTAPAWLPEFVDRVADFFEPYIDVGRVGYECAPNAERWEISMYLGATEAVGGRVDGEVRSVAFQFDLAGLSAIFESVAEFRWNRIPVASRTNVVWRSACWAGKGIKCGDRYGHLVIHKSDQSSPLL